MEELVIEEVLKLVDNGTTVELLTGDGRGGELRDLLDTDEAQKLHQWLGSWLAKDSGAGIGFLPTRP